MIGIQNNIDMESYTLKQTRKGKLSLPRGQVELEPIKPKDVFGQEAENPEPLSNIIKELNERFGTKFSEEDRVFIKSLEEMLADDVSLETSMKVNTPENAAPDLRQRGQRQDPRTHRHEFQVLQANQR